MTEKTYYIFGIIAAYNYFTFLNIYNVTVVKITINVLK